MAASMGPYLLWRDLKYRPLFRGWLMIYDGAIVRLYGFRIRGPY